MARVPEIAKEAQRCGAAVRAMSVNGAPWGVGKPEGRSSSFEGEDDIDVISKAGVSSINFNDGVGETGRIVPIIGVGDPFAS